MNRIERQDDRIVTTDWKSVVVCSASKDAYPLYKEAGMLMRSKIGSMTDEQILKALANAVKLEF